MNSDTTAKTKQNKPHTDGREWEIISIYFNYTRRLHWVYVGELFELSLQMVLFCFYIFIYLFTKERSDGGGIIYGQTQEQLFKLWEN